MVVATGRPARAPQSGQNIADLCFSSECRSLPGLHQRTDEGPWHPHWGCPGAVVHTRRSGLCCLAGTAGLQVRGGAQRAPSAQAAPPVAWGGGGGGRSEFVMRVRLVQGLPDICTTLLGQALSVVGDPAPIMAGAAGLSDSAFTIGSTGSIALGRTAHP